MVFLGDKERDLVFIDVETTGLSPTAGHAICEVAALKVRQAESVDKFQSLVNPGRPIPAEAYMIHGISDDDVREAPAFRQLAGGLFDFVKDTVLCAYNVGFDLSFLNCEFQRAGQPVLNLSAIDVLAMARTLLVLPRYNLQAVASFFQIEPPGNFHRALDDVLVTRAVFFKLCGFLEADADRGQEALIARFGISSNSGNSVDKKSGH